MKIVRGGLAVLCALSAWIAIFFTALELSIFDMNYIDSEMEKLSVARDLNMEEKDLHALFSETMKYLSDDRDDLVIETVVGGQEREAYNEREKLHMVDVKGLFMAGFSIRTYAVIVFAITLALYLILGRKQAFLAETLRVLAKTIVITWLVLLAAIAVLLIIISSDFDAAFIRFHLIFFDNDLWLLDPADSLMINMLPEEFFFDMAMRIARFVLIPIVGILLACAVCWRIGARKRREAAV